MKTWLKLNYETIESVGKTMIELTKITCVRGLQCIMCPNSMGHVRDSKLRGQHDGVSCFLEEVYFGAGGIVEFVFSTRQGSCLQQTLKDASQSVLEVHTARALNSGYSWHIQHAHRTECKGM